MSTEKTPAERIISLRKRMNMNTTEFARALEVTQPCVAKWEKGLTLPNGRQLIKIYNLFGFRPCWILLGLEVEKKSMISGVE